MERMTYCIILEIHDANNNAVQLGSIAHRGGNEIITVRDLRQQPLSAGETLQGLKDTMMQNMMRHWPESDAANNGLLFPYIQEWIIRGERTTMPPLSVVLRNIVHSRKLGTPEPSY